MDSKDIKDMLFYMAIIAVILAGLYLAGPMSRSEQLPQFTTPGLYHAHFNYNGCDVIAWIGPESITSRVNTTPVFITEYRGGYKYCLPPEMVAVNSVLMRFCYCYEGVIENLTIEGEQHDN